MMVVYLFFMEKLLFLIAVLYESDLPIYFSATIKENKKVRHFLRYYPTASQLEV